MTRKSRPSGWCGGRKNSLTQGQEGGWVHVFLLTILDISGLIQHSVGLKRRHPTQVVVVVVVGIGHFKNKNI